MGQELVTRTLHRGVVRKRILPIELFDPERGADRAAFAPDPASAFDGLAHEADLMAVEPEDAACVADVTKIDPQRVFGRIVTVLGNVGLAAVRLDAIPRGGAFAVHRPHPSASRPTFVLGRTRIPAWWPHTIKT